jgi:hypothetical protein
VNGNILILKKFILLAQGGTFKILPARYYKPVPAEEPVEAKTDGKTSRRRFPAVLFAAAGCQGFADRPY